MNPLTLSIIGLYKTAVIRRLGSWRTYAGHGVDGSTQPVPHARAVVTGGIVGPTPCACAHRRPAHARSRLALAATMLSLLDTGSSHARPDWPLPTMPAPTAAPPVGRRRNRRPHTDAHPGEPDPGCADEKLAGRERGHAGRHVVPRDDGAVHVRGVAGVWQRTRTATGSASGNAPGHVQAHATLTPPTTRNARMSRSSMGPLVSADRPGPRAGRGAFPQGYMETGATPPKAGGGV